MFRISIFAIQLQTSLSLIRGSIARLGCHSGELRYKGVRRENFDLIASWMHSAKAVQRFLSWFAFEALHDALLTRDFKSSGRPMTFLAT